MTGRIAFLVAAVGAPGVASHGRAASSLPDASLRADVVGVGAQMHQLTAASAAFSVR